MTRRFRSDDPILNAVLRAWNQDQHEGATRSVLAYVSRWPSHERLIRETYARLTGQRRVMDAGLAGRSESLQSNALADLLARELPFVRAYVRLRGGERLRRLESDSDLVQSVCREALLRDARRALEQAPNHPSALANLGHALSELRRFDEAELVYRQILEVDPENADAQASLAYVAEAAYRRARELDPLDPHKHCVYARLLNERGRIDEAIAECGRALELDPFHVCAYWSIGLIRSGQGRLVEAIDSYRKALEIHPVDAKIMSELGSCLSNKGEFEEAVAEHRKAIDIDPRTAQYHYSLGVSLFALRRYEEAIAANRNCLELNPRHLDALNNLGCALMMSDRSDEAFCIIRKVLSIDSADVRVHENLGIAFWNLGRLDEAIEAWREVVRRSPSSAVPWGWLSRALRIDAAYGESLQALRRTVEAGGQETGNMVINEGSMKEAERLAALEAELLLAHDDDHPPEEARMLTELARILGAKGRDADALSVWRRVCELDTQVFSDPRQWHRYSAARSAIRAAMRAGADTEALRSQALEWLAADLHLWKDLRGAERVTKELTAGALRRWIHNPALKGVREPALLATLSDLERTRWETLWSEASLMLASLE